MSLTEEQLSNLTPEIRELLHAQERYILSRVSDMIKQEVAYHISNQTRSCTCRTAADIKRAEDISYHNMMVDLTYD